MTQDAVSISVENRKGNYNTIGPSSYEVHGRLFTAWIEHGRQLRAAQFYFQLFPNATAQETAVFAQAQNIAAANVKAAMAFAPDTTGTKAIWGHESTICITNTDYVQGAAQIQPTGGLVGAVFWSLHGASFMCAAVLSFAMDGDGIIMVHRNKTHVTATLAHPAKYAANTLAMFCSVPLLYYPRRAVRLLSGPRGRACGL